MRAWPCRSRRCVHPTPLAGGEARANLEGVRCLSPRVWAGRSAELSQQSLGQLPADCRNSEAGFATMLFSFLLVSCWESACSVFFFLSFFLSLLNFMAIRRLLCVSSRTSAIRSVSQSDKLEGLRLFSTRYTYKRRH